MQVSEIDWIKVLAYWGAFLSTILAFIKIYEFYVRYIREKSPIKITMGCKIKHPKNVFDDKEFTFEKIDWYINVVNTGQRPVIIVDAGFKIKNFLISDLGFIQRMIFLFFVHLKFLHKYLEASRFFYFISSSSFNFSLADAGYINLPATLYERKPLEIKLNMHEVQNNLSRVKRKDFKDVILFFIDTEGKEYTADLNLLSKLIPRYPFIVPNFNSSDTRET